MRGGTGIFPAAIVVLSVEEQDIAEFIFVTNVAGAQAWRFVRVKLSGDSTDPPPKPQEVRWVFTWKDEKSSTATRFPGSRGLPFTSRMERLD